jgi:hypothetical protein
MNIDSSNYRRIGLWLAASVLGTSLIAMTPSPGQALPLHDAGLRNLAAGQQDVQTVQHRRHWHGHRHHRHHYRSRGTGLGIGLATGALIGGAIASQGAYARARDADAYCSSRFRSYDPSSGTYLGYDGRRHACP